MGLVTSLLKSGFKLICFTLILCTVIVFLPGIPPRHVRFEAFTIKPSLKLEGKLAANSILNRVQVLKVDRELDGPESISLRGEELYFGDKSGQILKSKNGKVSTVAQMPGFPCTHLDRENCSFPLATRFNPNTGRLVITDIYGGLLDVDVDTGKVRKLIARHEIIEGDAVGFPEDLDISKDGTIYWSDGTTTATLETMWYELMGHPSGRLLKFEPSQNKSTVLLRNIHFANGVQLSANEDFVLVGETVRCQIRRYYLKGVKKGQSDIFIDGLPGYPDNIRSNTKGGFYVSLYKPRLEVPFPVEACPLLRKLIARTLSLLDYGTRKLCSIFPSDLTKFLNAFILSMMDLQTKDGNAFILELNEKGEILGSLQSTNSALHGISQITVGEKYTYFASPENTKIWYMDTYDLLNTS